MRTFATALGQSAPHGLGRIRRASSPLRRYGGRTADTYTVVNQYPGLHTLGGTQTQDVVFVGITTLPHGNYLFPVAKSVYAKDVVAGAALGWADIAETLWKQPHVVGVQQTQVVNQSTNPLLVDHQRGERHRGVVGHADYRE